MVSLKFATDLQNPSDIVDNNIQAVLEECESWSGLENYFKTKNKEFLLTTEEARCCNIASSNNGWSGFHYNLYQ